MQNTFSIELSCCLGPRKKIGSHVLSICYHTCSTSRPQKQSMACIRLQNANALYMQ